MIIGLTGNIGAGKTTVAKIFRKMGARVIEADKIGKLLLQREEIKKKVVQEFGEGIIKEGEIDPRKLREKVFKNKNNLKKLEEILHPLMVEEMRKEIKKNPGVFTVLEAAILLEKGWESLVDKVVVVKCPREVRFSRMKGKFTLQELEKIEKSQISEEKKIKRADYIIDNSKDFSFTQHQVKDLFQKLTKTQKKAFYLPGEG